MSEIVSTNADEVRLAGQVALKATGATADTPVQVFLVPSASARIEEARKLMRVEDAAEAQTLVESFVEHLRSDHAVQQVWAALEPDLLVTVVVNDDSLETELRTRAIFVDLAAQLADPSRGDLDVLPAPYEPEDAERIFSR